MIKIHLCYPINGKKILHCKDYEEYTMAIKIKEFEPITKRELNTFSIPHTNIAAIEVDE